MEFLDMAKQSQPTTAVATKTAEPAGAMALMRGSSGPMKPIQNIGGASSPYLMFSHVQSPQNSNLVAAFKKQLDNGTPILVQNGEYTILDPLQFMLLDLDHLQYFADFDSNNDIRDCAIAPVERIPVNDKRKKYKEVIETIILAIDDGKLYPARVSFRGPKCPAVKSAIAARMDCDLPEFAGRSKDHKIIAGGKNAPPKFSWHTTVCDIATKDPKNTDNDEKEYQICTGVPQLSTVNILAELGNSMKDAKFLADLQSCLDDHNKRVEEVIAIANRAK